MATITDVARHAKVSVATVSRVLNESGYVDEQTRARVQRAITALNFERNINWSRLRRKSSQTILFLLGNREGFNPMHMRVLMACERVLRSQSYDLIFARHEYPRDARPADLPLPAVLQQSGAIDGVILAGVHHPNLLQTLHRRRTPFTILANDYVDDGSPLAHSAVTYDDRGAVEEAAEFLIRLRHTRIAFIGNRLHPWFERRYQGYFAALQRHTLSPIAVSENWPLNNHDYGQMAMAQLLKSATPPTAVIAGNDELAAGAWRELVKRHIPIPGHISLIGVGDRLEYAVLEPALTSISVFAEQIGERLSSMLLTRIANPKEHPPSEIIPCKLMERASVGKNHA